MTGGRLKRLQSWLSEGTFMMTYGDGVGNVDIHRLLEFHRAHGKLATVTAARPQLALVTFRLKTVESPVSLRSRKRVVGGSTLASLSFSRKCWILSTAKTQHGSDNRWNASLQLVS